jgi:glycosyltransferase involved in cell wall biosynthesis
MDSPLVSVILPVYNAAEFIKDSVFSILNQTYRNIELIVINDGSTDNSVEIIQSFNDKRIKIISHKSNKGIVDSINEGIEYSNGQYIARMDADDICHFNRIHLQVLYFQKNNKTDILGTYTNQKTNILYHTKNLSSDEIKARLLFDNILCHPTIMFKKDLFFKKGIRYDKNFIHAEDYALWLELIDSAHFSILPVSLLKYREHPGQVSKSFRDLQIESVGMAHRKFFNRINFSYTEHDLSVHKRLFFLDYDYSMDFLLQVEEWLLKLESFDSNSLSFSSQSLRNILSWVWFEVCTDFLSHGFDIDDIFKKSELYKPDVYSKKYLFRYEVKNIRNKLKNYFKR